MLLWTPGDRVERAFGTWSEATRGRDWRRDGAPPFHRRDVVRVVDAAEAASWRGTLVGAGGAGAGACRFSVAWRTGGSGMASEQRAPGSVPYLSG